MGISADVTAFCPNFRTVSSCRVAVVEIQGSAEPRMAMDYTAFLLYPTMADGSTDCRDPDDCALNGNAPRIRQPLDATMPAQRRSFDLGIHL